MTPSESLGAGMIGYFTTGIKEPGLAVVGDTITPSDTAASVFPGYQQPDAVIWASLYPQQADDYTSLVRTLKQMRLSDAAFSYEGSILWCSGKDFVAGF